jgi:hypothetical protein
MAVNAIYSQASEKIDFTAGAAYTSGDILRLADGRVGVIPCTVASGGAASAYVTGQFDVASASATTFSIGDTVFWSPSTELAITAPAAAADFAIGTAVKAKANGDANVRVELNGSRAGLKYRAVAASTAITNTTTETAFSTGSYTFPAGSLRPGDVIRVLAQGTATATNGTDTLTVKLYLGTEEIASTGAVDAANGDIFYIEGDIVVRTIGATGTVVGAGTVANGVIGTAAAEPWLKASATEDLTGAVAVTVKATWSAASTGDSCRLDVFNVQLLQA